MISGGYNFNDFPEYQLTNENETERDKGNGRGKIDTRKSAVLPKYHSDIGFLVRVGV